MPGVKIPSFPFGGAMLTGLRIQFPPDSFENAAPGLTAASERVSPQAARRWNGAQHDAASRILLQTESKSR
jgi:hypothetical protein